VNSKKRSCRTRLWLIFAMLTTVVIIWNMSTHISDPDKQFSQSRHASREHATIGSEHKISVISGQEAATPGLVTDPVPSDQSASPLKKEQRNPTRKGRGKGKKTHVQTFATGQAPVLFIHYHKTGHDVSRLLARSIARHWHPRGHFINFAMNPSGRRVPYKSGCAPFDFSQYQYAVQAAPNLFCNVSHYLPEGTKIVHFVRDPVEMAISSYSYHSQNPPPEGWVIRHYPCNIENHILHHMAQMVNVNMEQIEKVIHLCKELLPDDYDRQYGKALRELPRDIGLRLETARFIISAGRVAGADLLRMGTNTKHLNDFQKIKHVSMSAFTGPNKNMTVAAILHFLFDTQVPQSVVDDIVADVTVDMKHVKTQGKAGKPTHVTRHKLTDEDREHMNRLLLMDPILSPVLHGVQGIHQELMQSTNAIK